MEAKTNRIIPRGMKISPEQNSAVLYGCLICAEKPIPMERNPQMERIPLRIIFRNLGIGMLLH
jgi:hypothetical protein